MWFSFLACINYVLYCRRLLVGLIMSLIFTIAELTGFLSGLSMFTNLQALFCMSLMFLCVYMQNHMYLLVCYQQGGYKLYSVEWHNWKEKFLCGVAFKNFLFISAAYMLLPTHLANWYHQHQWIYMCMKLLESHMPSHSFIPFGPHH